MWLWSKGLGRLIMPMEFSKAEVQVDREGEALIVRGLIVAPKVHWDYTLSLQAKDLVDFMEVLTDRRVVAYLVREKGQGVLKKIPGRVLRFGLAYLWAELKKSVSRGPRAERA